MKERIPTIGKLALACLPILGVALIVEYVQFLRRVAPGTLLGHADTFRYPLLAIAAICFWLFRLKRVRSRWLFFTGGMFLLCFSAVGLYFWWLSGNELPIPWVEIVVFPFGITTVLGGLRTQSKPDSSRDSGDVSEPG